MDKVLGANQIPEQICLFCGNKKESCWDEWQRYYICRCEDSAFNKELSSQIEELQAKFRKPKFELTTKIHITKKSTRLSNAGRS